MCCLGFAHGNPPIAQTEPALNNSPPSAPQNSPCGLHLPSVLYLTMKCVICKSSFIPQKYLRIVCRRCRGRSKRAPLNSCIRCGNKVKKNWSNGALRKFCSMKCRQSREFNHKWKGGFKIEFGYRMKWIPPDKRRSSNAYVREHRWIMEYHLGRKLRKNEVVHHKNHDKLDNRLCNLEIMTRSSHSKYHCAKRHATRVSR